jgi:hypothetical protein
VGRRRRRLENRGRLSRQPRISSSTTDATDSRGTSLQGLVSDFSALVQSRRATHAPPVETSGEPRACRAKPWSQCTFGLRASQCI